MTERITVKYICRSNLDSARGEEWPTVFIRPPAVGELVKSKKGRILRIIQVTHGTHMETVLVNLGAGGRSYEVPLVEIELHLPVGETMEQERARTRG